MFTVIAFQFAIEPYKSLLLGTKDCQLVEGTKDRIWGIGTYDNVENCWNGQNLFGQILKKIRNALNGKKYSMIIGDSIIRGLSYVDTDVYSWGGVRLTFILKILTRFTAATVYDKVIIHSGVCSLTARHTIHKGTFVINHKKLPKVRAQITPNIQTLSSRFSTVTFIYSSILPRGDQDVNFISAFDKAMKRTNCFISAAIDKLDKNFYMVKNLNISLEHMELYAHDKIHLSPEGKDQLLANYVRLLTAVFIEHLSVTNTIEFRY